MRFQLTPDMTLYDLELLYKLESSRNFARFRGFGSKQQLNE